MDPGSAAQHAARAARRAASGERRAHTKKEGPREAGLEKIDLRKNDQAVLV
jgi:hypothetical protein